MSRMLGDWNAGETKNFGSDAEVERSCQKAGEENTTPWVAIERKPSLTIRTAAGPQFRFTPE